MTNTYDGDDFFEAYANMPRSRDGLEAAGEWHQLRALLPDPSGMDVLDMGCGYGWHSKYAAERGAASVLGFDMSGRMIAEARARNADPRVTYEVCGIEDYAYPEAAWDLVISNLALHYVADLDAVYKNVYRTLRPGGVFLMNIEHPVFTSGVRQDWLYDGSGAPLAWPVDDYFYPGARETIFLGRRVTKQHHTLTQILMGLINSGFALDAVEEARPPEDMLELPGMRDELRRPMMLLVRAVK